MDDHEPAGKKQAYSWITSLAITVVCLAMQSVFFAGYVSNLKEDIHGTAARIDTLERRVNSLNVQADILSRKNAQQPPPAPGPDSTGIPVQLTPAPTTAAPVPLGTAAPMELPVGTVMPIGSSIPAEIPNIQLPKAAPMPPKKQ